MTFALGPRAAEAGYRLAAYETVGSTNEEAKARARTGDPGRLWVVSLEQTQGRGRRGRAWTSPPGNLAASLLMPVASSGTATATLGFAAGLALHRAICAAAPFLRDRLQLKWPNDVLMDGAKVAGILLEAVRAPQGQSGVVIGIGVNVRHAPDGLPYPATSLAERAPDVTAAALFEALAEAWVEQEGLWNAGAGFAAIRDRWLDRAAGLGAPVAVRVGEEVVRGTFETIDTEGRLVMRGHDGAAHLISAGDVHFGTVASARA